MSDNVITRTIDANAAARSALQTSAIVWFVPALIGQWYFAYHIAVTYIATAVAGDFAAWNKRLFVGFVAGDVVGNIALVAHLFIAFVMTIGGMLQLIPKIRTIAPAFHRWNGRLYIVIAFVTSLAALYMIWTRDTFGGILVNDISVSIDAVLIMVFAAIALRYAMIGKIGVHRRWALRTFMAASGVWFTRVIYGFLRVVPGETPGSTDDMTGPTNIVIGFASYLLPLAVLELYFLAQRSPSMVVKFATAALVLAAAVATSVGVYGTIVAWLR
ncbi:MAG: DUF2306 domain-containing protein [Acidobacteriota bacterium]